MAIKVSLLTTRPQCDEVLKVLNERLKMLGNREGNLDYSSDNREERATELNEELLVLNRRLPRMDTDLADLTPGSKEHKKVKNERREAEDRRDEILALLEEEGGPAAVLKQSKLKETQACSTSIEEDITLVTNHRETLPA